MRETIIVAGSLAQKPRYGGHTWVFLQYLLGFRRLGWDVLFLDQLELENCRDAAGNPCSIVQSLNLRYVQEVMERYGLQDSYAVIADRSQHVFGLSRTEIVRRLKRSAILLNVMGFLRDEEMLAAASRRVFLDIDPGFGQFWRELGLHDMFQGHDAYVTIGENIGKPDCSVPSCGLTWITTPQPIVLDRWPLHPTPERAPITSVVSWRGAYGPIEYQGTTYGLRVHEFRRFLQLPQCTHNRLQLALDIHPSETKDIALLRENGWELVDPLQVTGDPWGYQHYIQSSRAELMVAKNLYVQTHAGWFSDRSLCYLASGKPVIAQETGFSQHYPIGEGLLSFSTPEEACWAIEEVSTHYDHHARVARTLAEDYFESDKVLGRLLSKLSV